MDAVVFGRVKKLEEKTQALENEILTLQDRVAELRGKVIISGKMLIVDVTTPQLLAGQSYAFSQLMDVGVNNLLIKSVYVEGANGSQIDIEILSKQSPAPFLYYKNEVTSNILYDVVEIPYRDEDAIDSLHLLLTNIGNVTTAYKIRIMGISTL